MESSSQHMDSHSRGEELNQLARLLFDSAANKWYGSVLLEIGVGLTAAIVSIRNPQGDESLFGALVGVGLLIAAYALRLRFESQYDTAETMRRQAALTEGLGWALDHVQFSEWRNRAGKSVRSRLVTHPRDPDYYASRQSEPGPRRLAEMTIESAFYTRRLYGKLRSWMWALFCAFLFIAIFVIFMALAQSIPDSVDLAVAHVLFVSIPVVVSIDFLGWALRLQRSIAAIRQVASDLERLLATGIVEDSAVMRLVAEYDCQLVGGFPIHKLLFKHWHDEFREEWEHYWLQR